MTAAPYGVAEVSRSDFPLRLLELLVSGGGTAHAPFVGQQDETCGELKSGSPRFDSILTTSMHALATSLQVPKSISLVDSINACWGGWESSVSREC